MSTYDYDAIVIGAGISGLTTAALLVKQGFSVLILEEDSRAGGLCKGIVKGDYHFDLLPSLLPGFQEGGAFNFLFRKLGIYSKVLEEYSIKRLDPAFQIALPDHRINLYSKRKLLFEELRREFPNSIDEIKTFYEKADSIEEDIYINQAGQYPYSFVRSNHNSLIPCLNKPFYSGRPLNRSFSRDVDRFFDIQTFYFAQRGFSSSPLSFSSVIMGITKRGLFSIRGGASKITDILASYISNNGGDILLNARVEDIIIKGNCARGVNVCFGGIKHSILSRCIISSVSLSMQEGFIKDINARKRYKKFIQGKSKKSHPFTILIGVDERVIPEPMKENLFMMRDYGMPSGHENYIYLSLGRCKDDKNAPDGKCRLAATLFVDPRQYNISRDCKKFNASKIVGYIENVIPFLSKYIDCMYIVDPKTYHEIRNYRSESSCSKEKDASWGHGLSCLSNKLPIKRLLHVGDSTYTGYGLTNAVRSGLCASDLISRL